MSATIVHLPNEILEEIFENLDSLDHEACLKVCWQWREVLESCSYYWRELCKKDFNSVYLEAYMKSNLSWRSLYKSLKLWLQVSTAEVEVIKTKMTPTSRFILLRKTIAYPERTKSSCPELLYDTVVYYNTVTYEETRTNYDVNFKNYAENELLIVIDCDFIKDINPFKLRLMPKNTKINKTKYFDPNIRVRNWVLAGNKVYYTSFNEFGYIKLISPNLTKNAAVHFELKKIGNLDLNLHNVIFANAVRVNVHQPIGKLTLFKNNQFHLIGNGIKQWRKHGLNPRYRPSVLLKYSSIRYIYTYHDVMILGTVLPPMIYVYYKPYDAEGNLMLQGAIPKKSINLALYEEDGYYGNVRKIEVTETEVGHQIFVLFCYNILIIDLTHEKLMRDGTVTDD